MEIILYITFIIILPGMVYGVCLPGEELANGTCISCKDGYFSKDGSKCMRCFHCYSGMEIIQGCKKDRDRQCICPGSTYLKSLLCRKCTVCEKGAFVIHECGHNKDRICKACPEGYTTNGTNSKTCDVKIGKGLAPSNNEEQTGDKYWKQIVIVLAIVVLSVCVFVFLFVYCKRKRHRRARRAVDRAINEEDAAIEMLLLPECENTNNHRKVRDLPANVYEELGMKLNPVRQSNWIQLACHLGFDQDNIGILKLKPLTATQDLLTNYAVQNNATAYNLYNALVSIRRPDAAELVEQFVYL